MKASGKGVAIIILFLVGIPVVVDLITSALIKENNTSGFSLSSLLFSGYLFFLPRYIWYLILAITITYLIKQIRSHSNSKK